jgi:hypothetical protein
MGYIPDDARWFYATIVVKIVVEGDSRAVVHENTVLVEASDRETAHARAVELGANYEYEDVNPAGKRVVSSFVGLRELDVVHEALEHGAELFFTERVGLSAEQITALVRPKENLNAFAEPEIAERPDYGSVEVVSDARGIKRGTKRGPPN